MAVRLDAVLVQFCVCVNYVCAHVGVHLADIEFARAMSVVRPRVHVAEQLVLPVLGV